MSSSPKASSLSGFQSRPNLFSKSPDRHAVGQGNDGVSHSDHISSSDAESIELQRESKRPKRTQERSLEAGSKTVVRMTGPQVEAIKNTMTKMSKLLADEQLPGKIEMEDVVRKLNVYEAVIRDIDVLLVARLLELKNTHTELRESLDNVTDPEKRADIKEQLRRRKLHHEAIIIARKDALRTYEEQYPAAYNRTVVRSAEADVAFQEQQAKAYLSAHEFYQG
ncbi:MAG: hypothetical protein Q9180_000795 [Flavoplaca navasiana]